MKRKRVLTFGLIAGLCSTLSAHPVAQAPVSVPASAPSVTADRPRPNVVVIMIDDLNDWVGCLRGHPQVKTPNIDRLAKRGTLFTNAHCQSPLCNPSRTSMLTGLRPSNSGVYALNPWFRTAAPLKDTVTLPQHFAANGYRTLTTGKVFHDGYPPRATRKDGDEFTTWGFDGGFAPRPPKKLVQTPAPMAMMDWGIFPERDAEQDDHKVADWAIDQLRTAKTETGKPFFLSVGFRHPHVPCFASKSWFDLYPEDKLRLPPFLPNDRDDVPKFAWYTHWSLPEPRLAWLQESNQWKPLVRSYLASISYVDSEVGRVLEALKENGLAENTVVVLLSDHGFHLGEKGISGKNTLWERSTRVPLIVAGPGVRSGAVCSRPAELLDLYPTLSELCALSAPPPLDGHSLVPQLKDAKAARPWPAITTHGPNNHAVRTENWRYIRYADGSEELYDMRKDPNEWKNLAADARYAKQKQELVRLLPAQSAAPVPNSSVRLIEIREGVVYWEGKPIGANDPIPQ